MSANPPNPAAQRSNAISPLSLVKLEALMERTRGRSEITIGLIDGPVLTSHPDLATQHVRDLPGQVAGTCAQANSAVCQHATFIAGILCATRHSRAPAICPECTLLVRPIFAEQTSDFVQMPSATPQELAEAIVTCVDAGVRVINLSAAVVQPSTAGERELRESLDYAAKRGVIVVAAVGNQGTIGSSIITRHPWMVPVVGCGLDGRPLSFSNLANSIAKRGLRAPGDNVVSLGTSGKSLSLSGTSVAAPFVTGTVALLWSVFPAASAAKVKLALTQAYGPRRTTIVPPLLDAWRSYQALLSM